MKTKMIMGMAIAAVMTVTSVVAFAAETDKSNAMDNTNGSRYESAVKRDGKRGLKSDKSKKLDDKLAAGEITQEEYDAINAKYLLDIFISFLNYFGSLYTMLLIKDLEHSVSGI